MRWRRVSPFCRRSVLHFVELFAWSCGCWEVRGNPDIVDRIFRCADTAQCRVGRQWGDEEFVRWEIMNQCELAAEEFIRTEM
jgi:hypothetical protein